MGIREDFVLRAIAPGANHSALCEEYGVSRKTGYKWLERYNERGLAGLEDMSRRPKESPLALDGDVVAAVVLMRQHHPKWGARKLMAALRRELGDQTPSERSINRVLVRTGFLQPGRQRRVPARRKEPAKPPGTVASRPNDLWTVDFKGWWLSMDNKRCEPLTIRDAYSRYLFTVRLMPKTTTEEVQAVFEEVFRKYGLPKAILTDNGPPFVASQGELGLTRLSVWWTTLGVEHIRTRPGKPSDNGGHERMHRDIAAELQSFAAPTRHKQQEACDRWMHDFNYHRPHEAIGMQTPAELYRRSDVEYLPLPTEFVYPAHFAVRRINKRGSLSYKNKYGFLSWALNGQVVGLEEVEDWIFDVWLRHTRIGTMNFNENPPRLIPERWVENAAVSP